MTNKQSNLIKIIPFLLKLPRYFKCISSQSLWSIRITTIVSPDPNLSNSLSNSFVYNFIDSEFRKGCKPSVQILILGTNPSISVNHFLPPMVHLLYLVHAAFPYFLFSFIVITIIINIHICNHTFNFMGHTSHPYNSPYGEPYA
jgi:hypothetical protein